jgi:endoglucanase
MKHCAWIAALAALCIFTPRANANPMLHAESGAVLDGAGAPVLLRCVNLSPWLIPEGYLIGRGGLAPLRTSPSQIRQRLEDIAGPVQAGVFWQQWTERFVTQDDFARLHAQGFNCVRLPLSYRSLVASDAGGQVSFRPEAIAPVDRAVEWGAKHALFVILDLHDAPGGQNPTPTVSDVPSTDRVPQLWEGPDAAANQRETVVFWRALAARYAHAASVGGYDLLNEPKLRAGQQGQLPGLFQRIAAAIRTVDGEHMLILEGNDYAHDFDSLRSFPDPNVMYEFHEYAIFNRAWSHPNAASLAPFLALRRATGHPLWLGEFGENTLDWQAQMVQLMKANNIGWSIWPWKRVALDPRHPVIETIEVPEAWKHIAGYLEGKWFTSKPTPQQAQAGMAAMLQAIPTVNCQEDDHLARVLAER